MAESALSCHAPIAIAVRVAKSRDGSVRGPSRRACRMFPKRTRPLPTSARLWNRAHRAHGHAPASGLALLPRATGIF